MRFEVSEVDFRVLTSLYKLLKGQRENEITRQMLIADSGVLNSSLSNRVQNYFLKEKLLNESREIQ